MRGTIRDYSDRAPGPEYIYLILEVSVSSVVQDRQQATVYAASGIPYHWIVNVIARQARRCEDVAAIIEPCQVLQGLCIARTRL